jgi:hypothetical protein
MPLACVRGASGGRGRVGCRSLDDRVMVRIEEARSVNDPLSFACDTIEPLEIGASISFVEDDRRTTVALRHHMVDRAWLFVT